MLPKERKRQEAKTGTVGLTVLTTAIALLAAAATCSAGQITGFVRDSTGAPLAGIDLDVLDDRLDNVGDVDAISAADGSFTLGPLNSGQYFVRADPTLAQGYVDQFHPGVFLATQASAVNVPAVGTVSGIDFSLSLGATISGKVTAADTGLPLSNIDMDILAATDSSFVGGVDAVTQADGTYTLGALPPGNWVVRADPLPQQGHIQWYFAASPTFSGALPVPIVGTTSMTGIDLVLPPGGAIFGTVRSASSGTLLDEIDLDLFDTNLVEIPHIDARSDVGDFELRSVPIGTYLVRADPEPLSPYLETWFDGAPTGEQATPIVVAKGMVVNLTLSLPDKLFISGQVRDATTSAPLAGIDLDLLDLTGTSLPFADAVTLFDGTYVLGPISPGSYLVRVDPSAAQGYVDQYHPGVFLQSAATALVLSTTNATNIDFNLSGGGTISGTVTAFDTGSPLAGIDLDVYALSGERIASVDADTGPLGTYSMGQLPPGQYLIEADPLPATGYGPLFYDGQVDVANATPVTVVGGGDTPGVDVALLSAPPTTTPPAGPAGSLLGSPYPNPFRGATRIALARPLGAGARVVVHDARGRKVRDLGTASTSVLTWDGRDSQGRRMAAGVYFMTLIADEVSATRRVVLME